MVKVGVPGGLYYYTYRPFIKTFFGESGISCVYSLKSDKNILDMGNKVCVDEACLPVKLFSGHSMTLWEKCELMAVPRLMTTEFGESICPKFCGLPELSRGAGGRSERNIFREPIYVNRPESIKKSLKKAAERAGISRRSFETAFSAAVHDQRYTVRGIDDRGYRYKVFLAGHSYNIYDSYANLNLIEKLRKLDIGIITEERVSRAHKEREIEALIKRPYWCHLINIYGAALSLMRRKEIDGIIYLSSFCCGTDSITSELIRNKIPHIPFLSLKIDEHTGEAGYDTRLEAFQYVLERRRNLCI